MIILSQIILFLLFKNLKGDNDLLFFSPKNDFIKINDTVTISCKTKEDFKNVLYRHDNIIIVNNCKYSDTLSWKINCGSSGEWNYVNLTVNRITPQYKGKYTCHSGDLILTKFMNIAVPPKIKMVVKDNTNKEMLSTEVKEIGHVEPSWKVYNLKNSTKKTVEVLCSNECAYPASTYIWNITSTSTNETFNIPQNRTIENTNECEDQIDMFKTSAMLKIDCLEQKLSGTFFVECRATGKHLNHDVSKKIYILCPDYEKVPREQRLKSEKIRKEISYAEFIQIGVGSSLALVIIISVLILICKKNDTTPYNNVTMTQSAMHQSGYSL